MACLQQIYTCVSALRESKNYLSVIASIGSSRLFPHNMLTILQDHISTLAEVAQFLGALDIAQSSGEVFIHYAADVPMKIGENDTPRIPLSLYRLLHLGGMHTHLFHCDTGDSCRSNVKYYWYYFPSGLAIVWMSSILGGQEVSSYEVQVQQPHCADLRAS